MKLTIKGLLATVLVATSLSVGTGYATPAKAKTPANVQAPANNLDIIRNSAVIFMYNFRSTAEKAQAKKDINAAMARLKTENNDAHSAIYTNVTQMLNSKTKDKQREYNELLSTIASLLNGMTITQINKVNQEARELAAKEEMFQKNLASLEEKVNAGLMTREEATRVAQAMGKSVAEDQQKVLESSSYLSRLGATLASPFQWVGNKIFDEETSNLKRAMYTAGATAAAIALGAVAYNYLGQPATAEQKNFDISLSDLAKKAKEVTAVPRERIGTSVQGISGSALLQGELDPYGVSALTPEGQAGNQLLQESIGRKVPEYVQRAGTAVQPYAETVFGPGMNASEENLLNETYFDPSSASELRKQVGTTLQPYAESAFGAGINATEEELNPTGLRPYTESASTPGLMPAATVAPTTGFFQSHRDRVKASAEARGAQQLQKNSQAATTIQQPRTLSTARPTLVPNKTAEQKKIEMDARNAKTTADNAARRAANAAKRKAQQDKLTAKKEQMAGQ